MKDDRIYVDHILQCIKDVTDFTRDGKEAFFSDKKTQQAVIRSLQVLAESTQRLSPNLRDRHPEVEWKAVAGFRNVVVHDYPGLDLKQIWSIVADDLPLLLRQMEALRDELAKG